MDVRLVAKAGHHRSPSGWRERKDSASPLAAAPAEQRSFGFCADVGHPRFATLRAADVNRPRAQVNVVPIQGQRLAAAQAAVNEHHHQCAVTSSADLQDTLHLFAAEHLHPLLLDPGHPYGNWLLDPALLIGKSQEGPHRSGMGVDGRGGYAALRDGRQKLSHYAVGGRAPVRLGQEWLEHPAIEVNRLWAAEHRLAAQNEVLKGNG